MVHGQNVRFCEIGLFQSATAAGTITSANVDTLDTATGRRYDYVTIPIVLTSAAATYIPTSIVLQECDTTVVTSFAAVTTFSCGATTSTTLPVSLPAPYTNTTKVQPYVVFNVDCRKRKRYLNVLITPTTTQTAVIPCILSRGGQAPVGTTDQQCAQIVNG